MRKISDIKIIPPNLEMNNIKKIIIIIFDTDAAN